ncbi:MULTISPECIES: 5-formyltetrahydrofolate cyclo-ligase [Aphanothece]|uniref:5-formyltetrahydrofolate cyclo-ligase n=1 Tax=Aphanothece TaxID=1121 RepID=UPI003984772E
MGREGGLDAARKADLRRHFRARRRRLLSHAEGAVIAQVQRLLPGLLRGEGRLGIYWPLEGEIDLRETLAAPGFGPVRLALPAIDDGRLLYRPWQPGEPLERDACGIPAPPPAAGNLAASALQLLLVPALAMDAQGVRLGYGGGWYDRLRGQLSWRRVPALAVLPAGCLTPRLPREAWDVPFDGWISEQGLGLVGAGSSGEAGRGALRDEP